MGFNLFARLRPSKEWNASRWLAHTVVAGAVVVTACGYDSFDTRYTGAPSTVELTLSSPDVMTSAGDTRTVTAVMRDVSGHVVSAPITWSTSAPGVATVVGTDRSAIVTAVGTGNAQITAQNGDAVAHILVAVNRAVTAVVVSSTDTIVAPGNTVHLIVTARDARGNIIADATGFAFSSTDTSDFVVSHDGVAFALFNPFGDQKAKLIASLTIGGVTAADTVDVRIGSPAPLAFDYASLLLTDYEQPVRVPLLGQGVAYFTVDNANNIHYTVTWSAMSGPITNAHLHAGNYNDISDVLVDLDTNGAQATFGQTTGTFSAANIRSQGGRPAITMDSLKTLLRDGKAYIDLHTAAFPNGEVRGQIMGFR